MPDIIRVVRPAGAPIRVIRESTSGLAGPPGDPGADGADGAPGAPGADGADGADGAPGADGADGAPGADGSTGWSPILAIATDGARRVLQVTDWTGGTGTEPATGYLGVSGLVVAIGDGVDVRGAAGADGADGADGTGGGGVAPFSAAGVLAVASGASRLYNDSGAPITISTVRASVGTAPTGASLIVDVNIGGTTIFTTQGNRPTITAGTNTGLGTPDVTAWPDGTYLTVDIDAVGSTVAGADLTVQVVPA